MLPKKELRNIGAGSCSYKWQQIGDTIFSNPHYFNFISFAFFKLTQCPLSSPPPLPPPPSPPQKKDGVSWLHDFLAKTEWGRGILLMILSVVERGVLFYA